MNDEEIMKERRRRRMQEARQHKKRQRMVRRLVKAYSVPAAGLLVIIVLAFMAGGKLFRGPDGDVVNRGSNQESVQAETEEGAANYALNGGGDGYVDEPGRKENGAGENGQEDSTGQKNGAGGGENDHPQGDGSSFESDGDGNQYAGGAGGQAMSGAASVYSAQTTNATKQLGEDITSSHAILIDLDSGNILAQKDSMSRISPASMTKILTVLVAAEHVADLDDTFTITLDITDYSYTNDCSSAGFAEDEMVTVRDLFYGTILPSGADAAAALAEYVAGSREAFVDMMNEKLKDLGLSETAHVTNCVGLYDEEHYCTAYDMAMILEAAVHNDLVREVMSAHTYTTSATPQHPEGLLLSNWFLRRIEDKDTGGEVLCAKTGYVVQSGNCAASFGTDESGKQFVCVTANASSAWRCIYDHVALYKQFSIV